jgi:two-component system sensor histidine kinase AtoS
MAITYANFAGVPVFGSSARIPALGWVLVAEKPVADALAWQRILVRRALATGLATSLAVLWLATRFSRRLAEPLRRLADTARQIAAGSTRQRVGMLPGAEADEVGHAFNEMLDALARAQEKVVHSASLAAIGELSVSVVHEMRNPLSSIKLNLQALRNKVAGDPDYAELADIAGRQASRLERMLSELLQFGKPLELRPAAVTFAELADSAIGILDASARERGVTLRRDDETGDRPLHVDREHLGRAIENLVRNAMEASPAGGTVWIEGRVADGRAPMLEIRVRDGGNGIPERVRQHLFQPFVTTREQGTGLGLANVKKVAELHDGNVQGANLPGGGALFVIAIPLQPGGQA